MCCSSPCRCARSRPIEVIARLRPQLAQVAGGAAVPANRAGHPRRRAGRRTRSISTRCRRTRSSDLNEWGPKLLAALQASPVIADVNSDQQHKGLETDVTLRSRHGLAARAHR